jgi:D-alanine-D-alanine ligase
MTTKRKNVAIVCGGDSGEYEISVQSGNVVSKFLDKEKFQPFLIYIKGKDWFFKPSEDSTINIDKNDFSLTIDGEKTVFDVVFNALHGTPGEDGKLLGYLDMIGIPYTSSNHIVSALTFNKDFCKQVVKSVGVALADSVLLKRGQSFKAHEVVSELGLPLFVKPNSNGSSVGVSKVNSEKGLKPALEKAFKEDEYALIESFIKGREIGCGVFEFKGRMMVLPLTEIISKNEFFDYDAKYTKGKSDEITPADVDEDIDLEIKALAAQLYNRIGCRGFVRFDFILTDEDIYFLEVNTVPGMSAASIIPQQAEVMGISLSDFFGMAIENVT